MIQIYILYHSNITCALYSSSHGRIDSMGSCTLVLGCFPDTQNEEWMGCMTSNNLLSGKRRCIANDSKSFFPLIWPPSRGFPQIDNCDKLTTVTRDFHPVTDKNGLAQNIL